MKSCLAIGLMSGSSLDGIDLVLTRLVSDSGRYHYTILDAVTQPYPEFWSTQLSEAFHRQPEDLVSLDKAYGDYLGQTIRDFMKTHDVKPDFVASHGHTVFHKPDLHYTLQIGDGQAIADRCGVLTVNDFRSEDVRKGGQGAPLVPIGDQLLFSEYDLCLNIGGIANISYDHGGKRLAYDICIANQALNTLAHREGLDYDRDGLMARSGQVNISLLEALNSDHYYRQLPPKSLGREYFETHQLKRLDGDTTANLLATFTEHIAIQIARSAEILPQGKLLITGGGAHNQYLVDRIQHHTKHQVAIPDPKTVDYKEALIFALLGMLRLEGRTNVLCSVTGAKSDSCSGQLWKPRETTSTINLV